MITPWKRRTIRSNTNAEESSLERFRGELDRVFDRFFMRPWHVMQLESGKLSDWSPLLDVLDKDDAVVVQVEVPGMKAEDFEITIDGRYLTIAGEKEESSEAKDEDHFYCERCYGAFRRRLEMPESADMDHLEATYANGILTLEVPKTADAQVRKIEVRAADKQPGRPEMVSLS